MRPTPHVVRQALLAALLAIGLAAAVAPSAFRAQASNADILAPRAGLLWSIQSADGQPSSRMDGESFVGPDGAIELGPYGTVSVAGMTLSQAQAAVEKHLARYLTQPRVTLRRLGTAPNYAEPSSLITVGKVVALPPPASHAGQTMIATWAQQIVPVAAVEPMPAEPPTADSPPTPKPAEPAAASGSTAGQWHPLVRDNPVTPARNVVGNGGWQPLPRGPVEDARIVQAEPPATDLKIYPRQVEPGPDGFYSEPPMPGMAVGPMGGPMPHAPPVPHELTRVSLPPYIIDPPDVLLIESTVKLPDQSIRGQHLVRPDGTVSLGIYGSVEVRGLTLDQAKDAIARQLATRIKLFKDDPEAAKNVLAIDVLAYNSKFYYIIADGGGYGEQVTRFPITGSETVLDAISQIGGLNPVSSKTNIWVARTTGGHPGMQTLPVDWCGITQRGDVSTNYQVMPNDRIYVKAKSIIAFDTALSRFLSPVERILGVTLLGSSTVNSIRNSNNNNNGNNNTGR